MKIYIAGPLFNVMERQRNEAINKALEEFGFTTFLPQRDGFSFATLVEQGMDAEEAKNLIYRKDLENLKDSDVLLFLFDGRVPDEGACFELGYSVAMGKLCLGLKTDVRSFYCGYDNTMLTGGLTKTFSTINDVITYLGSPE